ncbi:MAG TPA: sigma factor, partial [Myxococcales bacterium]|nr:sigma factor [Myxococcales bacterium]
MLPAPRAPFTLQAACAAHLDMLHARARRFLRGREADALDFTQQAMERFLEAFPDGPPPEPRCGRWLLRTLDNLLISEWRKASVRRRALVDPSLHCGREIEIDAFPSRTPLEEAMDELSEETFL